MANFIALVDWARYERVMASSEAILNAARRAVLGLFDSIPSHVSVEMPEMDPHPATSDQRKRISDLRHCTILIAVLSLPAPAYYADLLLAHLRKSIKLLLGSRLASPVTLSSDLVDFAVYKLEKAINTEAEKLRQYAADRLAAAAAALRTSTGPSPKRRPSDEDELRLDGYAKFGFHTSHFRAHQCHVQVLLVEAFPSLLARGRRGWNRDGRDVRIPAAEYLGLDRLGRKASRDSSDAARTHTRRPQDVQEVMQVFRI